MEGEISAFLSRNQEDSVSGSVLNTVLGDVCAGPLLKMLKEKSINPREGGLDGCVLVVPTFKSPVKRRIEPIPAVPKPTMSLPWNPIPVTKRKKPEIDPEDNPPSGFLPASSHSNPEKCAKMTEAKFDSSSTSSSARIGLRKPYTCPVPPPKAVVSDSSSDNLKGQDEHLVEMIESEIMSRNPGVKWADIAGLDFAKKAVHEAIVWPLLRPELFTGIRAPPKGLLLFGPPGTGKTLIGKAIASEAQATFFNISASSLTSKWIGEAEKLVRILFSLANKHQPSVIFIDEIDSLLCSRSDNEQESSRRIKTEFLTRLDGATTVKEDRILLIGTTNRPQELDEAMRRRMSKRLYIPLPNAEGRLQLLLHLMNTGGLRHGLKDQDFAELVQMTKGYSGADLYILCSEAALNPLREMGDIANVSLDQVQPIQLSDFQTALRCVKPSVAQKDLENLLQWNLTFGSFQVDPECLNT